MEQISNFKCSGGFKHGGICERIYNSSKKLCQECVQDVNDAMKQSNDLVYTSEFKRYMERQGSYLFPYKK